MLQEKAEKVVVPCSTSNNIVSERGNEKVMECAKVVSIALQGNNNILLRNIYHEDLMIPVVNVTKNSIRLHGKFLLIIEHPDLSPHGSACRDHHQQQQQNAPSTHPHQQ
jgi:hypothetical protein